MALTVVGWVWAVPGCLWLFLDPMQPSESRGARQLYNIYPDTAAQTAGIVYCPVIPRDQKESTHQDG